MEELAKQLQKGIDALHLSVSIDIQQSLLKFLSLLMHWNRAYNLTGTRDPSEIITRHFLDSLSIASFLKGPHVVDVGTGAGFPGIPLALVRPDLTFVLLDSNGKKTRFLTEVVSQLQMTNTKVVQSRVESYQTTDCFNTITVRAVSSLPEIVVLTRHLGCSDASLLCMKGASPEAELEKIEGRVKVYELKVPGLPEQRHLVCIEGIFSG